MSRNNSAQEMLIQNGVQDKKGGRNDGNRAGLNHTTPVNSKVWTSKMSQTVVIMKIMYKLMTTLKKIYRLVPHLGKKKYEYVPTIRGEADDGFP